MSELAKKLTMEITREERDLIVARREEQERNKYHPRSLEEYEIDDKCKFFDEMYGTALSTFQHVEAEGYTPKDIEQHIYEEVMALLTPRGHPVQGFWNHFNHINKG